MPKELDREELAECEMCKKLFKKAKKEQRFCSVSCSSKRKLGEYKKCIVCSKEYYAGPYEKNNARCCSISCRAEANKTGITKACIICGKSFYVKKNSISSHKCCSRACYYKKSTLGLNSVFKSSGILRDVMKREGLVSYCNRCGYNKEKKILMTHHIDRDRDNNVLDNIEVLCPNCHAIEHYVKPIEGISLCLQKN